MCHILSSENRVPFSFKELKCSPRGAPSTNSIIMYNLSSVKQYTPQNLSKDFVKQFKLWNNIVWENNRHLATPLVSPRNDVWGARHYLDLGSASDWSCHQRICFNQSEAPPRSGEWHVTSMEFLLSFFRLHFKGKQVMASRNVGCFLMQARNSTMWK